MNGFSIVFALGVLFVACEINKVGSTLRQILEELKKQSLQELIERVSNEDDLK